MKSLLEVDRHLATLTEAQIAYLAGLFDSCGMVTMTPNNDKAYTFHLSVTIFHRERRLMRWLLATTGIGRVPARRLNHGYDWRLRLAEIRGFLRAIYPYVSVKKSHVIAALEYLNGYEPGQGGVKPTFEQARHRLRSFERLQELNRGESC